MLRFKLEWHCCACLHCVRELSALTVLTCRYVVHALAIHQSNYSLVIHKSTGAARRRSVASSAYLTSSDEDLSDDDTANSNSKGNNSSSGHHSRSKTATGGATGSSGGVRGLSGSSSGNRRGSTGGSSSKSTSRCVPLRTAIVYMLCHTAGSHNCCMKLLILRQLPLQCIKLYVHAVARNRWES
jgi:hypothetical protein